MLLPFVDEIAKTHVESEAGHPIQSPEGSEPMKITILWSSLASYSVELFRELSHACEIQLVYDSTRPESPYEPFDVSFCRQALDRSNSGDNDLQKEVLGFSPDVLLMSSWNVRSYMAIARSLRKRNAYVISTIDHQWHGTLKQWLGVISAPWFLKPAIDTFLVAGDRQAYFARKLGYDKVLYGLYAASVENFICETALADRDPSFLFVGRLTEKKGVRHLIDAYRDYRQHCERPWALKIVGTGLLKSMVKNSNGIEMYGFVQPSALSAIMKDARALILPSVWEPWGVVIHEAAAAGLPIIATYECGAVPALVRDGVNGFIIKTGKQAIAEAMLKMTHCSRGTLDRFGRASARLAALWTPGKLADYLVAHLKSLNVDTTYPLSNKS
jgi:glycosyltransferase involved in cell wall biosynthesis